MLLPPATVQVVALAAAGVALAALALSLWLATRLTRLGTAYGALVGGDSGSTFTDVVSRQHRETVALRGDVQLVRESLSAARADLSDALRHVAVVRYDAFGDMGGRLSFSAALLDDAGDGLVLTSINGRSETRTYAKGVSAGDSEQSLSPEELEAIGYATRPGRQPAEPAGTAPSRRRRSRT